MTTAYSRNAHLIILLTLTCSAINISCQEETLGQQVAKDKPFELKIGQQVKLQNENYTIRLDSLEDTRCDSANIEVCYGGVATLYLTVHDKLTSLDTAVALQALSFRAFRDDVLSAIDTVQVNEYAIELLNLLPASPTDDNQKYVATLLVQQIK